jgi:muramoyltetrapeptide carboxypeptidase
MNVWRSLEAGEPIGVVALSGPVDPDRLVEGVAVLRSWGQPVELASNLGDRAGYLAGTDEARLNGLVELLDRGIRTLVAARGGYGVTRLLDRLPWQRLRDDEVRFVGFSDLTALLNPLSSSTVQLHGPMVAAGLGRPANADRLRAALQGSLHGGTLFRFGEPSVVRHGRADGVAVGGNLSLMAALMGTPWEADLSGTILFLEEVHEPAYRLDRLMTQLAAAAGFGDVRAVVCGSLHGCRPRAECLARFSEIILDATGADVPVVFGRPFGHGAENLAFPIGSRITVDTRAGKVLWVA